MSEGNSSPPPFLDEDNGRSTEEVGTPQRKRRKTTASATRGRKSKKNPQPQEEVECFLPIVVGEEDALPESEGEGGTQASSVSSQPQRRAKQAYSKRANCSLTYHICWSLMMILSSEDAFHQFVVVQDNNKTIKWSAVIDALKTLPPSTISWLEERSEQVREGDWVRNKAIALKRLLLEHPYEPISFSGESSSSLEAMRSGTTRFFIQSEVRDQVETYKLKLVQQVTNRVRDYWLKMHRIYVLPATLVETQQYQLQQWIHSFDNVALEQLILRPESKKVPDNLVIKEGFEKELQDVQWKPKAVRGTAVDAICEKYGYHADQLVIQKHKEAEREREMLKEQSIDEAEEQVDQAMKEFRQLQDRMDKFFSQVVTKLDSMSEKLDKLDKLDQVSEQLGKASDQICSTLDQMTERLSSRLQEFTAAILLGAAKSAAHTSTRPTQ